MYSSELRQPGGWKSMPLGVRVAVGIATALVVVGVGASSWASVEAQSAANEAAVAAEKSEAALARAEDALERVEQESLERDYQTCENANEVRAGILAFVTGLIVEDGTDEVTEGEQVVLDFAAEKFGPQECPPDPSPGDPLPDDEGD